MRKKGKERHDYIAMTCNDEEGLTFITQLPALVSLSSIPFYYPHPSTFLDCVPPPSRLSSSSLS